MEATSRIGTKSAICPSIVRIERNSTPQLSAWFTHPDTRATFRRALEQALLEGKEDENETLSWEQCYDWLAQSDAG